MLLNAPSADVGPPDKRRRIRTPLMLAEAPPALPLEISAHLDGALVRGEVGLTADAVVGLHSLLVPLRHWFQATDGQRASGWADPWAFRDLLLQAPEADPHAVALLCLLVHPSSFTMLLRPGDRARVVEGLADRLPQRTDDVERDLLAVVLALQAEAGGHGIDLEQPPLSQIWRDTAEGSRAWLVRGEVEQRNRVPTWLGQKVVTCRRVVSSPCRPSRRRSRSPRWSTSCTAIYR